MNKRDIIFFSIGFLVGYAVIKTTTNNVVVNPATQSLPDTFAETIPPAKVETVAGTTQVQEPEIVETSEDPKITYCKEKWIKFAETRKFSSTEQEQTTYDNFMRSCVAQS